MKNLSASQFLASVKVSEVVFIVIFCGYTAVLTNAIAQIN